MGLPNARAHPSEIPAVQPNAAGAQRAASDPVAAPELLEEAYWLSLQIGDTNPGHVQDQLLELAERTGGVAGRDRAPRAVVHAR